eukprot:evm.model.scf_220.9 EVM.evm.TU.scf_220.9   scf_220:106428-110849(+)
MPMQLATKESKRRKCTSLGRNIAFESDWVRYGRVTVLDAGSRAQLCCGAVYPDCVTDAPPLVFDVIFLDDRWLFTMDFVPLFAGPEYEASYIAPLKDVRALHQRIMVPLPDAFYSGNRWISTGLMFASSNMFSKDGTRASDFAEGVVSSFSDGLEQYVCAVSRAAQEKERWRLDEDALGAQMSHIAWLWKHTHPSHALLQKYVGEGWTRLVKDVLWRDTHGLDRWGARATDDDPSYHEVYSDELSAAGGDVPLANRRLKSLGLSPLEYIYVKPDPTMLDINKDLEPE